jgi:hypothetical protein
MKLFFFSVGLCMIFILFFLMGGTLGKEIEKNIPLSHRDQIKEIVTRLGADTQEERNLATRELQELVTEEDISYLEKIYYEFGLEERARIEQVLITLGWVPFIYREDIEKELINLLSANSNIRLGALSTLVSIPNIKDRIQGVFQQSGSGEFEVFLDGPNEIVHNRLIENPLVVSIEAVAKTEEGFWASDDPLAIFSYRPYYRPFGATRPVLYETFFTRMDFSTMDVWSPRFTNIELYRFYRNEDKLQRVFRQPIYNKPGDWFLEIYTVFRNSLRGIYIGTDTFNFTPLRRTYRSIKDIFCNPNNEGNGSVEIRINDIGGSLSLAPDETYREVTISLFNGADLPLVFWDCPQGWAYLSGTDYRYDDIISCPHLEETFLEPNTDIQITITMGFPALPLGEYNLVIGFSHLVKGNEEEVDDPYSVPYIFDVIR